MPSGAREMYDRRGAMGLAGRSWIARTDSDQKEGVMGSVVLRAGARRARRLLLLAGLVFAALPAGSALAEPAFPSAIATIGMVGGEPGEGNGCFAGPVVGDTNYVVPREGGTIFSFSFQSTSDNTGQQLDFLVLRPEPKGRYLVVGKTGVVTLKGTGLETFPANIPVAGGDILGVWSHELDNCFRDGPRQFVVSREPHSDPNTGQLIATRFGGDADLNESAHLDTMVGAPPPPTNKKQCKHGGWKKFGSRFKNQGQCVRFVEHHHHKKHHHERHHPSG